MKIQNYSKCNCGAITLYFDNGQNNSVLEKNLLKFDIVLPKRKLQKTYACNHCVNHYGLDLCACGSGDSPELCNNNYKECGNPYNHFGESVKFNLKI